MNKDAFFLHDKLVSMSAAVINTDEKTSLFDLLNNTAFTFSLFVRDYYLTQTKSASETERLMINMREYIDGMTKCIPDKLAQLPPDDK